MPIFAPSIQQITSFSQLMVEVEALAQNGNIGTKWGHWYVLYQPSLNVPPQLFFFEANASKFFKRTRRHEKEGGLQMGAGRRGCWVLLDTWRSRHCSALEASPGWNSAPLLAAHDIQADSCGGGTSRWGVAETQIKHRPLQEVTATSDRFI